MIRGTSVQSTVYIMLDVAAKCTTQRGCGLDKDEGSNKNGEEALYDDLLVLDLEDMTLQNTLSNKGSSTIQGFDLVVAADVLVYFGSLSSVLQTFSKLSTRASTCTSRNHVFGIMFLLKYEDAIFESVNNFVF